MARRPSPRAKVELLHKLVDLLVEQWGFERVEQALARTRDGLSAGGERKSTRKATKPSAENMVAFMEAPMNIRELLTTLGRGLDKKSFLPTSGSMRHFLEMRGIQPGALKRREDAFRTILAVLRDMSPERLNRYIDSMNDAGPGDLALISDAIGRAGSKRAEKSSPGETQQPQRDPS